MQILTVEWSLPRGLRCDLADRLGKQLRPRLFCWAEAAVFIDF